MNRSARGCMVWCVISAIHWAQLEELGMRNHAIESAR